jgi:uncharacterized protein
MDFSTIEKTIRLSTTLNPRNTGIIFFGGEPLLRKDLIFKTIALCRDYEKKNGYSYHFKITTNGLLLDEPFLLQAARERLQVALSIDGIDLAHDRFRRTADNKGTFTTLEGKIDPLLYYQPYAYALMTICPETLEHYCNSVEYLINKGFRYIIASLNYAGQWTLDHLKQLKKEYQKLARLYKRLTLAGKKFYFSPFEKKLATHIHGKDALCQRCHFGIKQISIAPDGAIYPCVQFVKNDDTGREFSMGHVDDGIDREKQQRLFSLSRQIDTNCETCVLNERCEHRCSCMNWQTTGCIYSVSPILCATEKILIPIVDRVGETLFKKRAPLFMQKHYNAGYPLISYMEDFQP